MIDAGVIGRTINAVLESKETLRSSMGEYGDYISFNWYLQLDNGLFVRLLAEDMQLVDELPEAVIAGRVNATKIVTGEVYSRDMSFGSEELRARFISEVPLARRHTFHGPQQTHELLYGRQISDVVVGEGNSYSDTRLILVLDGTCHLAVWNQEDGNLLQFDEIDLTLETDDDKYHRYFDRSPCDTFGRPRAK